jgi:8-amino-7-oxononanoate synthase
LNIIKSRPHLREQLNANIGYFRNACSQCGIEIASSQTAIQPVIVGDTQTAVAISEQLFAQGILVTAIRPPTVPEGTARLRITLSAAHAHTHIDKLVSSLDNVQH